MANVLKDNGIAGTPIPLLPTGEQQIVVSILRFFFLFLYCSTRVFVFSRSLVVFDQ